MPIWLRVLGHAGHSRVACGSDAHGGAPVVPSKCRPGTVHIGRSIWRRRLGRQPDRTAVMIHVMEFIN